jgi:hypothetical protein
MNYYRKQKFSLKYRIEKWFYEDSIRHIKKLICGIGMLLICAFGFAMISIVPALFK